MKGVSLHYSKVGYDLGKKIAILVSTENDKIPVKATLNTNYLDGHKIREVYSTLSLDCEEKWGRKWYQFDFSAVEKPGTYILIVHFEDGTVVQSPHTEPVDIGENLLWNRTWYSVSLEQLDVRKSTAYVPEGGWRDCGSPLQEVSSHLIMLDSLCDLLENKLTPDYMKEKIYMHICTGADYVCKCRDKADELGFGKGAVVHEIRENLNVSSGNCARTAVVLSRISMLLKDVACEKSEEYLAAAEETFQWIVKNGPISYTDDTGNLKITHGANIDFATPPNQFMTRDLLSLIEAALNFVEIGKIEYKEIYQKYTKVVLKRQVPKEKAEEKYYGHFYTYDNVEFTEKADLHCGAWDMPFKNYNQGAHMPYWILPLIRIAKLKGENLSKECDMAIRDFAYGFLMQTVKDTPFGIIPLGYYLEQGLCFFSGCYHGHSKIYGFITKLAMILSKYLEDTKFVDLATDNLQWVAGLNAGDKDEKEECYHSRSLIVGIGSSYHTDWNNLRGTVINGYDADGQFSIHPVIKELDKPTNLDDEGGIHHSSGFLSGVCYYTE